VRRELVVEHIDGFDRDTRRGGVVADVDTHLDAQRLRSRRRRQRADDHGNNEFASSHDYVATQGTGHANLVGAHRASVRESHAGATWAPRSLRTSCSRGPRTTLSRVVTCRTVERSRRDRAEQARPRTAARWTAYRRAQSTRAAQCAELGA